MSAEVINSLAARCSSLEDIIRQQEQTFSALLLRLRDVEQRVNTDQRSHEATQQQVTAMIADRNGVMVQFDRVNAALTSQNDRVGALEAAYQGTQTALQGIDQKYDAVVHGIENRIQGDIGNCYQRIQASDQSNGEAIRALQTAHQGHIISLQAVDNNARASLESHQQQVSTELAGARQRTEALEAGMRQALQDVHGALSTDIRTANAQMDALLRSAVQTHNDALLALDQRVRGEVLQLTSKEQNDMNAMRSRTEELEGNLRSSILSSHNSLTSDVGSVAQQLQALESRQRAAHQDLIQELSKHDGQMETIDVNWRASVLDLNGKVEGEVNGLQSQINAGAQAVVAQFNAQQSNFANVSDQINRTLGDLARTIQDRCILPLENANTNAARQQERINRLTDEAEAMREYMKTFSQEVDRTSTQFRQVIEAAVRASHSDLLERINTVAAATALRADPDEVYSQINTALTKIWGDVRSTYTTQRDLNEIQGQIATLETAVRTEILSLVQKNNEVLGKLDEVQQSPRAAAAAAAGQQRLASRRVSEVHSTAGDRTPSAARQSITEVSRDDAPMPIVHEPEMDADELRTLSEEALKSARTAEEAERRCVESLNESKSVLETILRLQEAIDKQKEELTKMAVASGQVPRSADAVVAAPPLSKEQLAVPASVSGFPSSPSSSDIRRVSGLVNKQDFIVRRGSADGSSNRGTPATISRGTPTGADGAPASPSEILLPTHQFLRKKEYKTFKDYVGHEIEAIWAEIIKLRRNGGVPREEVQLLNAQSKQDIVQTVLSTMSNQERDLVYALRTIQLELNAALKDLNTTSQIDVIQGDGFTDFDALRAALIRDNTAATPKLIANDYEPAVNGLPREAERDGRPPRRPSKPQVSRPLRPLTDSLTPRDDEDRGELEEPLRAEFVQPVHRRHSLDRDDVAESPTAFGEATREGPARLEAGVSTRPPLWSNEEVIRDTAAYMPPAPSRNAAEGEPSIQSSYHKTLASSFDTFSASDIDKQKRRGSEGPPRPIPVNLPLPQEDRNTHLETKGTAKAPFYETAGEGAELSPLRSAAPPALPPLRAQDYHNPRPVSQHPLSADIFNELHASPTHRALRAEDFSFSDPRLPEQQQQQQQRQEQPPPPLRAEDYDEPRGTAPPPLRAADYSEPRRRASQQPLRPPPPPLRAEDRSEARPPPPKVLHAVDYSDALAPTPQTRRAEEFSFSDPRLPVLQQREEEPETPRPLRALEDSPAQHRHYSVLPASEPRQPNNTALPPRLLVEEYNEPFAAPTSQQLFAKENIPFIEVSPSSSDDNRASGTYRETATSDLLTEIAALEKQIEMLSRPPPAAAAPLSIPIPIPRAPSATLAPYNPQLIRVNPVAQAYHLMPLSNTQAPAVPYRVAPAELAPNDQQEEPRRSVEAPRSRPFSIPNGLNNGLPPRPLLRIEDKPAPAADNLSHYHFLPPQDLSLQPYHAEAPRPGPIPRPSRTTTPPPTNYTSSVQPAQPARPKSTPLPPPRPLAPRSESMTSDPETRRPQSTLPYVTKDPRARSGSAVRVLGDHMYEGPTESRPPKRRTSCISTSGGRMEPAQQKEGIVRFHPYDVPEQ